MPKCLTNEAQYCIQEKLDDVYVNLYALRNKYRANIVKKWLGYLKFPGLWHLRVSQCTLPQTGKRALIVLPLSRENVNWIVQTETLPTQWLYDLVRAKTFWSRFKQTQFYIDNITKTTFYRDEDTFTVFEI